MKNSLLILSFIFLFSSTGLGAPSKISPLPDDTNDTKDVAPNTLNTEKIDRLEISNPPKTLPKPPPPPATQATYLKAHTSSLSPRLGLVFDTAQADPSANIMEQFSILFGFNYMFHSISSRHVEIGADLISDSTGYFTGAYKWVFRENLRFRPHLKAGLCVLLDPKLGMGNFIDYKQYSLRLAMGIEDLISYPMSVRFDVEAIAGLQGMYAFAIFGYSWAW